MKRHSNTRNGSLKARFRSHLRFSPALFPRAATEQAAAKLKPAFAGQFKMQGHSHLQLVPQMHAAGVVPSDVAGVGFAAACLGRNRDPRMSIAGEGRICGDDEVGVGQQRCASGETEAHPCCTCLLIAP